MKELREIGCIGKGRTTNVMSRSPLLDRSKSWSISMDRPTTRIQLFSSRINQVNLQLRTR